MKYVNAKTVSKKMKSYLTMSGYADKVEKLKIVCRDDLEKILPDYVSGGEDKQFSKINGIGVDLFTASFIKVVYDNVNDKNKKCMEVMSIANLIGVAQTLMPKYGMSA